MPTNKSFNKVQALLSILKIKLSFSDQDEGNGIYFPIQNKLIKSKIIYPLRINTVFLSDKELLKVRTEICLYVLHEIGHFIVTPSKRRRQKDFGIPEFIHDGIRFKYDFEEIKAVMVENELRRLFGFSFSKNLKNIKVNISERNFIRNHKKKIIDWWNSEGKILAKTYADLI